MWCNSHIWQINRWMETTIPSQRWRSVLKWHRIRLFSCNDFLLGTLIKIENIWLIRQCGFNWSWKRGSRSVTGQRWSEERRDIVRDGGVWRSGWGSAGKMKGEKGLRRERKKIDEKVKRKKSWEEEGGREVMDTFLLLSLFVHPLSGIFSISSLRLEKHTARHHLNVFPLSVLYAPVSVTFSPSISERSETSSPPPSHLICFSASYHFISSRLSWCQELLHRVL